MYRGPAAHSTKGHAMLDWIAQLLGRYIGVVLGLIIVDEAKVARR